jgi:hypothetical protein
MRTTITLEPDVVELLEAHRRERRISFKQAVNEAIRAGLATRSDRPFVQQTYSLGFRADIDLDRARHLAEALEDQEIIRKLARGA